MQPPATIDSSRLAILLMLGIVAVPACRRRPTYHEDVEPLLSAHCASCHAASGVAPVPRLGTYAEAVAAADRIAAAVKNRDMPPWGADNSGHCRTWHGAAWLPDRDVRTIVEWAEGGRSEGAPSGASAAVAPLPPFGPVAAVADIKVDFAPSLGPLSYRCFVVDPGLAHDELVSAFRVISSEPRSVEQVTLYALGSASAEQAAVKLDGAEPGAGFRCYGSPDIDGASLLMSWTWDSPVLRLPEGYAIRVGQGRKLLMQIHYNVVATGLGVPTRTRVELERARDASKEAAYLTLSPPSLHLPAGRIAVEASAEVPVDRATEALAVVPRMHTLGKTMQLDLARASRKECVASFDHWSFYRQRIFLYESPLRIEAGDTIRISCVYNTQGRTQTTEMGERIEDEECLAALLVAR
jgi:hypothetical protein